MRVLLVGYGSIAQRHLNNLLVLQPSAQVWLLRQSAEVPTDARIQHTTTQLAEALAWQPEAAIIANPAPQHIPTALALAQIGTHLLIEKPLSDTLAGIEALEQIIQARQLVALVGYNLRFSQLLNTLQQQLATIGTLRYLRAEVGQYLPDWRPHKDYRQSVSAQAALGGGALLELSHEFDYTRWLINATNDEINAVWATTPRLSDLAVDVEDTAEVIMYTQAGALISLHVDFWQRAPRRVLTVAGTHGTLMADFIQHELKLYSTISVEGVLHPHEWQTLIPYMPHTPPNRNAMYQDLMVHFLECIAGMATPSISLRDGAAVVRLVVAAKRSAIERQMITL